MEASASPHREAHHAAPERGGYEPINPNWLADFRFDAHSGLKSDIARGRKSANNGSRAYSIISSQRASIFLRWSFGQPGLPQSFFVSQKVFGPPRAQHGFESGNT